MTKRKTRRTIIRHKIGITFGMVVPVALFYFFPNHEVANVTAIATSFFANLWWLWEF